MQMGLSAALTYVTRYSTLHARSSTGSNSHWCISFSQANPVIYNTAFTLLNKAVHSPANPVKFPTDFEKALVQAVHRYQFPNSNNSQGLLLPLYPDNLEKNSSSWSSIALGDYWGQHCSSCVLGETCLGTLPA